MLGILRVQIDSSCSRCQRPSSASKVVQGPTSPTVVDRVQMEGERSSRRHHRRGRQVSEAKNGQFSENVGRKSTSRASSSSETTSSLPAARRSTNTRHAPADFFQFHSPEVATTNANTETSWMNPWLAETEGSKNGGLVRHKSDLGQSNEVKADTVASRDTVSGSGSLRRSGIQPPSAVHRRGEAASSSYLSAVSEPENNGEQNLRASSSTDNHSLARASRPQVTTQTTPVRPHVLALSDHITCLRQKNLRRRDDVIASGDHVISNSASEHATDDKSVNGEW